MKRFGPSQYLFGYFLKGATGNGPLRAGAKAPMIPRVLLLSFSIIFLSRTLALPATSKIDLALGLIQRGNASDLGRRRGILKPGLPGEEARVETILRFEGDLSGVESLGGRIRSVIGNIATVDIPLSAIDSISQLPNVVYIEAAKRLRPHLNASVPETGANKLRSGTPPNWTGNTGRNVIIGIVDSGIDLHHADFKNASGKTRILSLWDQNATTVTPPSGYSIGHECTQADIDAGGCPETDTDGHGTHVAGIAAGNGSATGNGQAAFRYVGMVPEADLVVVQTDFKDTGILDGIAYIQAKAAALGKPSVINLSLGSDIGPHDGTSNFERGLNGASGAGKVIVAAAGNGADENIHASGSMAQSQAITVQFSVPTGTTEVELDFWYAGVDQMGVSVANGPGCSTPTLNPGESISSSLPCGLIQISSSPGPSLQNHDREIFIDLSDSNANRLNPGAWSVTLSGITIANGRFDGWLFSDHPPGQFAQFSTNVDSSITVTSSGTADKAITVAAYNTKNVWSSLAGPERASSVTLQEIASFSGRGPRRLCSDLTQCPAVQKPEIAAPGNLIMSSLSADAPLPSASLRDPDGVHFGIEGTSMAAPHVAGAVALLLQAAPTLTSDQIKNILTSNTKADFFTGSVPNNTWGYGKLNAQAAFAATPNPPPATPVGLTATGGNGAVTLSWTANTDLDLDGYNLYRSATSGAGYVKVAPISYKATSFTNSGLTNGTTYFYLLRAVDTKGQESGNSIEVSAVPASSASVQNQSNGTGGGGGDGGCAIGWNVEFDPTLPSLAGLSFLYLSWKRIRRPRSFSRR